mmetsp:Transcript_31556/g.36032  ORF Transcript_31556/g.36032 Transcript_31556/m.36032 type:complete len:84 (+) Transcript_31556:14-265(+)
MMAVVKLLFRQLVKEAFESNEAISYFFSRFIRLIVYWIHIKGKSYKIKNDLSNAETFEEWEMHALKLDKLLGLNKWKLDPRSD